MVYSEKMCVLLVSGNQVFREANSSKDGEIVLPFGTDYSLRFKNLHSERAVVKVEIDGNDVLNGDSLLVNANSTLDLDGFLTGSAVKNKFRFIEKTQEVKDFRGDSISDGFIRVEFQFEKPKPEVKKVVIEEHYHYDYDGIFRKRWNDIYYGTNDKMYGSTMSSSAEPRATKGITGQSFGSSCNSPLRGITQNDNEEGITVKGSETNQQFRYASTNELEEQKHVIIIRLRGIQVNPQTNEVKVVKRPILVRTEVRCSSCGRMNKSSSKFCPRCGTFL